jgi:tRNA A-37 threonylcarbamoyl transferase component Bud32
MAGGVSPPARTKDEKGKVEVQGRFSHPIFGKARLNKTVKNLAPYKDLYDKNIVSKEQRTSRTPDEYMSTTFGVRAKSFAGGVYGKLYKLNVSPAGIKRRLDNLRSSLKHLVQTNRVPQSGLFAVKVAMHPADRDWATWVRDNVYEAEAHVKLATRCVSLTCAAKAACAPSPRFYFAGVDPSARVFVTVMQFVQGDTLYDFIKHRRTISASTYLNIEKAVVSMWLNGIVHGDLHADNILISPSGNKVWLVDFGFAVVLPDNRLQALRNVMDDVPNVSDSLANSVWYAKNALQGYVNSVLHLHRHLSWYNADGKLLKYMYNMVPVAERSKIGKMRRQLWGCKPRPGLVSKCIGKIIKKKGQERCVANKEQANPNPRGGRKLTFLQRKNIRRLRSPAATKNDKEAARQRLVAQRIVVYA